MSKNSFLDKIEVKSPCSQDWEEMRGSDKVRFCSHCDLNVNNLSAMTRKEALRIAREADGRLCVRYIKNPETNAPVFADRLYQISRRAGITAGVMASALTISTMTYAQGGTKTLEVQPQITRINQPGYFDPIEKEKDIELKNETVSVSGTITDPQGAVIPNAAVTLTNDETGESRVIPSSDEGFYKFDNIAPGIYTLKTENNYGFKTHSIKNLKISGSDVKQDISLDGVPAGTTVVTMGDVAFIKYDSPLHRAVSNDELKETKNLIARGESVNVKDKHYNKITPLFLAVENGNLEITETLLDFGAKVNAKDENRQTPLMRLDSDATPELVNLLIKHGAKVNLTDNEGNTALMFASSYADAEVLRALIVNGANINARNKNGRTALMNAIEEENLKNVKALILAGADVNLENIEGETAWDLAADEEVKMLLESYGAKVKAN